MFCVRVIGAAAFGSKSTWASLVRQVLVSVTGEAIDLETANRALGLGRATGYDLAKRSQYPCTVLRIGRIYRIPTASLLEVLHVEPAAAVQEQTGAPPPTAEPSSEELSPTGTGWRNPADCCDCCPCTCRRNARRADEEDVG